MTINWHDAYQGAKLLASPEGPREFIKQVQTKKFWQDFSNTVVSGSEIIGGIAVGLAQPELGIGEAIGATEEVANVANALKQTAKLTGTTGAVINKSIDFHDNKSMSSAQNLLGAFESLAGSQLSGFNHIGSSAERLLGPLKKADRLLGAVGISSGLLRNTVKNPLIGLPQMTAVQMGIGIANEAIKEESEYLNRRDRSRPSDLQRGVFVPPHEDYSHVPNSGYVFTQSSYVPHPQVLSGHSGGRISAVS
jgi:hypothetical protein